MHKPKVVLTEFDATLGMRYKAEMRQNGLYDF